MTHVKSVNTTPRSPTPRSPFTMQIYNPVKKIFRGLKKIITYIFFTIFINLKRIKLYHLFFILLIIFELFYCVWFIFTRCESYIFINYDIRWPLLTNEIIMINFLLIYNMLCIYFFLKTRTIYVKHFGIVINIFSILLCVGYLYSTTRCNPTGTTFGKEVCFTYKSFTYNYHETNYPNKVIKPVIKVRTVKCVNVGFLWTAKWIPVTDWKSIDLE